MDQDLLLEISADLGWLVLVDVGEPALLEALLGRGLNVLAIVSSPLVLEGLVEYFEASRPPGLGLCCQLLGAAVEDVCWFRYNDSRKDGRLPPQLLQPRFPNLRLEGLEARSLGRLDDLVQHWSERLDISRGAGGLVIRQGEVLPILKGATALLSQLSLLGCWQGEACPMEPDELTAISALVASQALEPRLMAGGPIRIWDRDEQQFLRNKLQAATARIEDLEGTNTALAEANADLQTKLEQLEPLAAGLLQLEVDHQTLQQQQQMTATALQHREEEHQALTRQLDRWRAESQQALTEVERLRAVELQLHAAIQAVHAELEQWRQMSDGDQADLRPLEAQINALSQVLHGAAPESEPASPLPQLLRQWLEQAGLEAQQRSIERDQIAAERDRLAAERDRLVAECGDGQVQRRVLELEKQELQEQLQQLAGKVSRSESQLESLKTMVLGCGSPTGAGPGV